MVEYIARDGYYIAYATGELDEWDHAHVALIKEDLHPIDWFIGASVIHTKPKTINVNPMTSAHVPKRLTTGRTLGKISTVHFLQSGVFTYAVMGLCTTTEGVKEVTKVTCKTGALTPDGSYFFINCIDADGVTRENYVWFTKGAGDPAPGGTGIQVTYVNGDTADQVSGKLHAVIDVADYYDSSDAAPVVTITSASAGAVEDAIDGNTTFTIVTDTQGQTTHAITKDTNETPINFAFHCEKEGTNANRRKDMEGFVPKSLDIYVSEIDPVARQTFVGEFSFTGAGSNLDQPTALSQRSYLPFTWYDTQHTSAATSFLYNTGAINVAIIGVNVHFGWTGSKFGTYDSNGYPTNGLYVPPFEVRITLECLRTDDSGTDIETISDLDHASYAGDLDYVIDFYESAVRYFKFTFDDMYVDPESFEETFVSEGDWFDGVRFDLVFRNESSSLVVEEKNSLDIDRYEGH